MTKLRLITILCAAAFVPTFMQGVAFAWTVVFAVVIAWFFRRRLEGIIRGYEPLPTQGKKALYSARHLLLAVLECCLYIAAPQITAGWFLSAGLMPDPQMSFLDAAVYKEFLPGVFGEEAHREVSSILYLALISFSVCFFIYIAVAVATLGRLIMIGKCFLYWEVTFPFENNNDVNVYITFFYQMFLGVFAFFWLIPLFGLSDAFHFVIAHPLLGINQLFAMISLMSFTVYMSLVGAAFFVVCLLRYKGRNQN